VHLGERDGRKLYEQSDAGCHPEHGQAMSDDECFKSYPVVERLGEGRVAHFLAYALDHGVHLIVYRTAGVFNAQPDQHPFGVH